jgi:aminopeptidase 2
MVMVGSFYAILTNNNSDITMISKEDTVNLSNMPVVSEKPYTPKVGEYDGDADGMGKLTKMFSNLKTEGSSGRWKVTKFQTTPLISSYLVAYANGPFEFIESSYTSPISGKVRPVRMYGACYRDNSTTSSHV